MTDGQHNPPQCADLNIAALSRLFDKTTTSYKYLFFFALLDILKARNFDISEPISFQEILVEVFANAWYPHTYFKLSFGSQDEIANKLDAFQKRLAGIEAVKITDGKKQLRQRLQSQDFGDKATRSLLRYVPFLLIRPFLDVNFQEELKRLDPQTLIPSLATQGFETCKPLYHFNSNVYAQCKEIILHPEWCNYLQKHYSIIYSWVAWKWLLYMQKNNPNAPAVASKLFPPEERESIYKQRVYWRTILKNNEIRCIYSNFLLNKSSFSLDHFLPWTFVVHDQLWNLIPTLKEVNSSKSNKLPATVYFDQFVTLQHQGLRIANSSMEVKVWEDHVADFVSMLNISHASLLEPQEFRDAYESKVKPMFFLAMSQKFASDWYYTFPEAKASDEVQKYDKKVEDEDT